MAEIAVAIIDPAGKRWAQLLDDNRAIEILLPIILDQLELPQKLKYELIANEPHKTLKRKETLSRAGIGAGSELELALIGGRLFDLFRKALYEEVEDHVKDQAWDLAEKKLGELLRLDPEYPDPMKLTEAVSAKTSLGSAALSGTAAATLDTASQPAGVQSTAAKSSSGANLGCLLAGVAIGGVVLIAAVAAAIFFVIPMLDEFSSGDPSINPGGFPGVTEPALGTGDVQVTLRWSGDADIDLHVFDPFGEEIWFSNEEATSGGRLDVDGNAGCDGSPPVENVFWPFGGAPSGNYDVYVVYYQECSFSGSTDYEVTILTDGQVIDVFAGTLFGEGEEAYVTSFDR